MIKGGDLLGIHHTLKTANGAAKQNNAEAIIECNLGTVFVREDMTQEEIRELWEDQNEQYN